MIGQNFIFFLKAVKSQSQPSTSELTIFRPNPVTTSPGSYNDDGGDDDDDNDDSNKDDPLTNQSFKFAVLFLCFEYNMYVLFELFFVLGLLCIKFIE